MNGDQFYFPGRRTRSNLSNPAGIRQPGSSPVSAIVRHLGAPPRCIRSACRPIPAVWPHRAISQASNPPLLARKHLKLHRTIRSWSGVSMICWDFFPACSRNSLCFTYAMYAMAIEADLPVSPVYRLLRFCPPTGWLSSTLFRAKHHLMRRHKVAYQHRNRHQNLDW